MDYSQMTNEQVNERLAVEVMGWEKEKTWFDGLHNYIEYWTLGNGIPVMDNNIGKSYCSFWQPTTDLNHAVMCAEKIGREIYIEKRVGGDYWVMVGELSDNPSVAESASLPRALSEAILQAVDNG